MTDRTLTIETRIIRKLVGDLLAYGYLLGVNDGEEITVERSHSRKAIFDALRTTDEDYLLVYRPNTTGGAFGWVRLIYGNGCDVLSDHTTNLDEELRAVTDLANRLDG